MEGIQEPFIVDGFTNAVIDATSLIPYAALDDFQIVRITYIEIYDRD